MDPRLIDLHHMKSRPGQLWRERGWWGRTSLWQRVRETALQQPAKAAVFDCDRVVSYESLWREAVTHGSAMRAHGLEKGDVVLVQLPNWHEFVTLAVSAEVSGVIFAFCPIQWGLRESVRALRLTRPKIWFTSRYPRANEDRAPLIQSALQELGEAAPSVVLIRSSDLAGAVLLDKWLDDIEVDVNAAVSGGRGSDPLEIAVTSGSTGDPKAVVHTHDSAVLTVDSTIDRQNIGSSDIIHLAVPVGHTYGYFYGVRCALQAKGTLLLQSRWDAHMMIELAKRHAPTVSLGPSAFIIDLLGIDRRELTPLSSLRVFTLAGDSLPAPTVRRAIETMPFRISRALGMTEFGHVCSTDASTPVEACIDTLGTPQPEMIVRIVDDKDQDVPPGTEGRIVVQGPFLFAGYLTEKGVNQNVLDPNGFFDTDDLGTMDDLGYLRITGRVKNIIRRGAETVPVSFLEDVIASHPDVVNAVVVGVPDERLGEAPFACVQLKPGRTISYADIERLFAQQQVTKKFWPVGLKIFKQLPTGATGKIDRQMILSSLHQTALDIPISSIVR
jgi:non-ribosomal peptide synthetase component E (peptide arylation enzyme)